MAHTFFGKIIEKIGGFFTMIFGSEQKVEDFLLTHADEGISWAQKLRNALAGKDADAVVYAIEAFAPDKVDMAVESIRTKVIARIDKVIAKLFEAKGCLQQPTFEARLRCFVDTTKKESASMQNAIVFKAASLYTQDSAQAESSKEVKESMTDTAVQLKLYANKIDLKTA